MNKTLLKVIYDSYKGLYNAGLLEKNEDILLAKHADKADKRWEKRGGKTISHKDLWKKLEK